MLPQSSNLYNMREGTGAFKELDEYRANDNFALRDLSDYNPLLISKVKASSLTFREAFKRRKKSSEK